jgi:hypothetical protein
MQETQQKTIDPPSHTTRGLWLEANATSGVQAAQKCSHGTETTQRPDALHSWRNWNWQISGTASSTSMPTGYFCLYRTIACSGASNSIQWRDYQWRRHADV